MNPRSNLINYLYHLPWKPRWSFVARLIDSKIEILAKKIVIKTSLPNPSGTLLLLMWTSHDVLTEKSAENFWVRQYWKAIEKTREIRVWRRLLKWFDIICFWRTFFRRSMEDDNDMEVEQFTMGNISMTQLLMQAFL